MTLEKKSQFGNDLSGLESMEVSTDALSDEILGGGYDNISFSDDQSFADDDENDLAIEPGHVVIFELDEIPGADGEDIFVSEEDEIEVSTDEDKDIEVEEPDAWNWQAKGLPNFLDWLLEMINAVPRHSGRDTTGLERAISYFEALDKEISKAMRMDYKDEIDSAKAEEARSQIEKGLERLLDRLEKVRSTKFKRKSKKKSWYDVDNSIVKEAQKSTRINGITITVPLFISTLARTCINGMVSAGHDIEDMFQKLAKRYNLTPREKAELVQLLRDMGYMHSTSRDRGLEFNEKFDPTSEENFDYAANFWG